MVANATLRRWLLRIILGLGCAYAVYLTGMYFLQNRLIFPGAYFAHKHATPGPTDEAIEQIWITTPEGFRVEAWVQRGKGRSAANPGPAAVFFHGNGDLLDDRWNVAQLYVDAGVSAMVVEYRGYGRATGKPSQTGIVADSIRFVNLLCQQPEVDADKLILHGISLGGAIAVQVAKDRKPAALIVESTFYSMADMANRYGGFGSLCRHPFRTDEVLPTLHVPILIFHGNQDCVIPFSHAKRLHALVPDSVLVERDCGHADYHTDWATLRGFLMEHGLLGAQTTSAVSPTGVDASAPAEK